MHYGCVEDGFLRYKCVHACTQFLLSWPSFMELFLVGLGSQKENYYTVSQKVHILVFE